MARLQIGVEDRVLGQTVRLTPLDIPLNRATVDQAKRLVRDLIGIIGANMGGAKVEDTETYLQVKYRNLFVRVRH